MLCLCLEGLHQTSDDRHRFVCLRSKNSFAIRPLLDRWHELESSTTACASQLNLTGNFIPENLITTQCTYHCLRSNHVVATAFHRTLHFLQSSCLQRPLVATRDSFGVAKLSTPVTLPFLPTPLFAKMDFGNSFKHLGVACVGFQIPQHLCSSFLRNVGGQIYVLHQQRGL